jgi:hypothetical protein
MTLRSSGPHRGQVPFPWSAERVMPCLREPLRGSLTRHDHAHRGVVPSPWSAERVMPYLFAHPSGAHAA